MSYLQRSKLLQSIRQWKDKAIARRQENVALKKRVAELIQSRDAWKVKAQSNQQLIAKLQAENQRVPPPAPKKKNTPSRYSHSLSTIQTLVAMKLRTSASFQAVAKSRGIFREYQQTSLQTAAPSTIAWWGRKLGYYALTRPKAVADDWVILLDHTMQLGAEKLCVILGIRESLIDFSRPLEYEDLEPLWMSASAQWNGEFISEILARLQRQLGRLKYAVGD